MIYGERIRLRAVEHEDLPMFVAWLNDPEVTAGLSLFLPMSLGDEEQWYQNMLLRDRAEHPLVIEISDSEAPGSWKPVGNCSFMNIDSRNRHAEVGIFIGEKTCWNQGYGTDAMRTLLKFGFHTLNLHRIFLRVFETNPRAIRAYEKAGYVHEGRMRQAEFFEGKYVDVLLMSVIRTEWEEDHGA